MFQVDAERETPRPTLFTESSLAGLSGAGRIEKTMCGNNRPTRRAFLGASGNRHAAGTIISRAIAQNAAVAALSPCSRRLMMIGDVAPGSGSRR